MPRSGLFIVLEGADGSGKGTQFRLLAERLTAAGYDVATFDFPRYDQPSSHFVRQYLNGQYGPAGQINPYAASMFYGLDRYEAAPEIRKALEAGKIVLSNRYAGSNMAHQGAKFSSEAQKRGFFMWADSLEFQLLGIPRPDLNLYLRVPAEISYELVAKKAARSYTGKKRDEHEKDILHLQEAVTTYDLLCRLFPRDYRAINCTSDEKLLSIPAINNLVWQSLQPYLHERLSRIRPAAKTISLTETSQQTALQNSSQLSAEPTAPIKNATYRIQALSYQSAIAVSGCREANIVFPTTQFARVKQAYFRPPTVQPGAWRQFQRSVTSLEKHRNFLLKEFKKAFPNDKKSFDWLAKSTLPLGAMLKLQLSVSEFDLKPLSLKLASSDSLELKMLSTQLNPAAVTRTDGKLYPKYWSDGPDNFDKYEPGAKVVNYWPKRDFELLGTLAYGRANQNLSDLADSLDEASYDDKAKLLKKVLAETTIEGLARQPSYEVEVLVSPATATYLIDNNIVDVIASQPPDPRYGYEVPELLERSGLDDDFVTLFDSSLQAYGELQSSSQFQLASYATLGGHRTRYLMALTARQAHMLNVSEHPPIADEVSRLAWEIGQQVADLHPIFWEAVPSKPQPKSVEFNDHKNPAKRAKRGKR